MRRSGAVAAGAATVALLVGCTGGDPLPTPPTSAAPTSTRTAAVEPVVVDAVLDGSEVALEVGPLAVHDGVAVLRLAAPVDAGTMQQLFWDVFTSTATPGPNGVRLVDVDAGTVTPVLRTTGGPALMTANRTPGGPATDAAAAAAGDDVAVVYAAFPAPGAASVDLLLPSAGWVDDVPVVAAAAAGTLTVPPAELLDEPAAGGVTYALESYTEAAGGQVRARTTAEQVAVAVASDVLFAFDSDQLGPDADAALTTAAVQVAAYPGGDLVVVGHTDDQADDAYNLDLSQRRAATVAARLAELADLSVFDVTVDGRGETEPAVPGAGEAERALNRRVELVLTPTASPVPADLAPQDAPLPDPAGPVARGEDGVSLTDGEDTFDLRVTRARRVGAYVVGTLEVTSTSARDLSLGALAAGGWDARGTLAADLQFAPTNVTLLAGGTRVFPVDYLVDPEDGSRAPLADVLVNGIAPGTVREVTVVWPDPGGAALTVDVAPRYRGTSASAQVQVAGRAPFRLTDVAVVDD